ncbi:BQ5605_C036g11475 [Microbotryum silenes-dioicae]|uniref:BQ5605_C036g11475 protein n=1 Tax=Microbotryum silenes-dioicae TaxID=796604 RepID=A0A2X0MFJ6_9BASI|nr:BQ5605_C036g11475 [Microbotryum silenes-dioicae]
MSSGLHTFIAPPRPFTVQFDSAEVDELDERLLRARWPLVDAVPDDRSLNDPAPFGMGPGPTIKLMKELAEEWRTKYQWKDTENHFNTFEHYKVEIENLNIHFLHHPSTHSNAKALILCHGWPGSFAEFLHMITLLTDPVSSTQQAYHVVVPSMPGFTFSDPPPTSKWCMDDTARVYDKLMTGLGYHEYGAQGGDWGSITARCLGALHDDHCKAVHLNFLPASPDGILSIIPPRLLLSYLPSFIMPDLRRQRLLRALDYVEKGSAYYAIQNLTPRTASFGLNDSPIGLLSWIAEKMIPFIDAAMTTQPRPTLTRWTLYETCTLYWLTHSIGTSFSPYSQNRHFKDFLTDPKYRLENMALSTFPNEIVISPVEWVKKTGDLKWNKEHTDGGHFVAVELPQVLTDHVREAFEKIWV